LKSGSKVINHEPIRFPAKRRFQSKIVHFTPTLCSVIGRPTGPSVRPVGCSVYTLRPSGRQSDEIKHIWFFRSSIRPVGRNVYTLRLSARPVGPTIATCKRPVIQRHTAEAKTY